MNFVPGERTFTFHHRENQNMRTILFLFALSFCASISNAQTVVVEDTHLSFFGPGISTGRYNSNVCQDLLCDGTCISFNYAAGSIDEETRCIDESSDWYVVELGEEFGAASIAANDHTIITAAGERDRGPVSVGGTDFYLGVSTGQGFDRPNPDPTNDFPLPNRDVFGWVHLRDNGGTLEFISSAVAYGSEGIIVGTTTAIPEPATSTGVLLLAPVAAISRSRKI